MSLTLWLQQRAKGLIPITTESGEIMWVHPDIVKDEQWEVNKPKLKGKTCNVVSLTADDDSMTVTSFSDSEGEKLALQPSISQPVGTRSDKQYFRQYDQTPDRAPQPATSTPVQAQCQRINRSRRRFASISP